MRIEFAARGLPDAGTLAVLAGADGVRGNSAEALDQRTGGAINRAIGLAGLLFVLAAAAPAAADQDDPRLDDLFARLPGA